MPAAGLVLFAHGSRDGRWAEPFERLRERVARAVPEAQVQVQVVLAYLELMSPDLPTAVAGLCAAGCRAIIVVPVFLGQGGHVRHDLPLLVQSAAARHPECEIRLAGAAGEDDIVLDAIAAYCLRQIAA